jgi:hypothetical protein
MAWPEDFNPEKEARRIVADYLSGLGWIKQWQGTVAREGRAVFKPEEIEERFRRTGRMMDDTEDRFSQNVEKYLHDNSPQAKEVLTWILKLLSGRRDLGFFCQNVLGHIRRRLGAF